MLRVDLFLCKLFIGTTQSNLAFYYASVPSYIVGPPCRYMVIDHRPSTYFVLVILLDQCSVFATGHCWLDSIGWCTVIIPAALLCLMHFMPLLPNGGPVFLSLVISLLKNNCVGKGTTNLCGRHSKTRIRHRCSMQHLDVTWLLLVVIAGGPHHWWTK